MKINFKKIAIVFLATIMCAGCGAKQEVNYDQVYDTKEYKDYFIIGSDFSSLNYLATHYAIDLVVTQNLTDGLVETDKYGQIVGLLAKNWNTDDYQTWTFNLKEGALWSTSEGEIYGEITADDFVYGIEYVLNPDNGVTSNLHFAYLLEGAEDYYKEMKEKGDADFSKVGVKAIDKYTVQYKTKKPMTYFLSALTYTSFKPANRSFVESIPDKDGLSGEIRFGTSKDLILYSGPYILNEVIRDNSKTLVKNENYHDINAVSFDKVEILGIKDNEMALEYFKNGELNRATLSATQVVSQQNKNSRYLIQMPLSSSVYGVLLNNQGSYEGSEHTNKAVNNENFRKSLMYGIDSDSYNEISVPGDVSSVRASTIVAEDFLLTENGLDYSTLGSMKKWSSIEYLYDKEKALDYKEKAMKELQAEGVEFPIVIKNVVATGNEIEMQQAQVFKASLEETLGTDYIKVVIGEYSTSWFAEVMNSNDYTVYIRGWGPDFQDPSNILGVWTSNSGQMNDLVMHWEYPEYDAMFLAADAITDDMTKRYEAFAECEAWLLDHAYFMPMRTNGGTYLLTNVNMYSKAYTKGDSQRYTHWEVCDHAITSEEMAQFKKEWEEERAKILNAK